MNFKSYFINNILILIFCMNITNIFCFSKPPDFLEKYDNQNSKMKQKCLACSKEWFGWLWTEFQVEPYRSCALLDLMIKQATNNNVEDSLYEETVRQKAILSILCDEPEQVQRREIANFEQFLVKLRQQKKEFEQFLAKLRHQEEENDIP